MLQLHSTHISLGQLHVTPSLWYLESASSAAHLQPQALRPGIHPKCSLPDQPEIVVVRREVSKACSNTCCMQLAAAAAHVPGSWAPAPRGHAGNAAERHHSLQATAQSAGVPRPTVTHFATQSTVDQAARRTPCVGTDTRPSHVRARATAWWFKLRPTTQLTAQQQTTYRGPHTYITYVETITLHNRPPPSTDTAPARYITAAAAHTCAPQLRLQLLAQVLAVKITHCSTRCTQRCNASSTNTATVMCWCLWCPGALQGKVRMHACRYSTQGVPRQHSSLHNSSHPCCQRPSKRNSTCNARSSPHTVAGCNRR